MCLLICTHALQRVIVIAAGMLLASSVLSASIEKISICGDGSGWPPYHYLDAEGGFQGYDLDVLALILEPAGIKYEFTMPPWRRCLYGVESNTFQVAVSASFSLERNQDYLLTKPYYNISPVVVGRKGTLEKFTSMKLLEILDFKLCGLKGYSYRFLLGSDAEVTALHDNYLESFRLLGNRPCDLLVARKEIVISHPDWRKAKRENIALRYVPISDVESEQFHMLISRAYPYSAELKKILDDGIDRLEAAGQLSALIKKREIK